jgi:hypothetical protein
MTTMNNYRDWINRQMRLGWIFVAAGLLVGVFGIVLPRLTGEPGFNTRIITGLGILLLGVGAAYLLKYGAVRRDQQAAKRLASEERDERTQMIRARAGNRAYWLSAAMSYAGLMWLSFAANGSLPAPSPDALWFFLAAVVLLPFGVYAGSIVYEQRM